jgi:hypothetical protein
MPPEGSWGALGQGVFLYPEKTSLSQKNGPYALGLTHLVAAALPKTSISARWCC